MLEHVIRFIKRLVVFVPVLAIAYISIFSIFPWFDDRFPLAIAAIITYVLAAYVLIPAIIRVVRAFFPASHLPLYCVTTDGFASDPLNIALIGTRDEVMNAMQQAGWHTADKITIKTTIRTLLSTVYEWEYPTLPMSRLYLFGRKQDLSFQLDIKDGRPGSRHHVRFWATNYDPGSDAVMHPLQWQHRQEHLSHDRLLWVGAASRDIGVTLVRHNAQLTHLVDSDTNAERELITSQLQNKQLAYLKQTISLGDPYRLLNVHALSGHIHTDGKMNILELSSAAKTANVARDQAVSSHKKSVQQ